MLKECANIATITSVGVRHVPRARSTAAAFPDQLTRCVRHVTKRGNKVYRDYLQNRHAQTIVAPYSVRPLPGATVSMALVWEEVDSSLVRRITPSRTRSSVWRKWALIQVQGLAGSNPAVPIT